MEIALLLVPIPLVILALFVVSKVHVRVNGSYSDPEKGRIPSQMLRQASAIQNYFLQRGLPLRPISGERGYQTSMLVCAVQPELGHRVYTNQERNLAWLLGNDKMRDLTIEAVDGTIRVQWTHPPDKQLTLSDLHHRFPSTKHAYTVGLAMDGKPVRIPLDMESPHVVVVGMTGSGKTIALINLLINALAAGNKVAVCNHKGEPRDRERLRLREWESSSNVMYAGTVEQVEALLTKIADSLPSHKGTLVIVDEVATLLAARPRLSDALGTICQMGRDFDVHVALAVPALTKEILQDTKIVSNVSTSVIGLRVGTSKMSYHSIGQPDLHLDKLAGAGDAKVIVGGQVVRAQIAFPDTWKQWVDGNRPQPELYDLDSITEEWLESIRIGGKCSIAGLQRYAAARGKGKQFYHWQQQFRLLERKGWVQMGNKYKGGVRVK